MPEQKTWYEEIFDSLEELLTEEYTIDSIGRSLSNLGIPAGERLLEASKTLQLCNGKIRSAVGRCQHERYKEAVQSTNNMMGAVLITTLKMKDFPIEESPLEEIRDAKD